LEIPGVSDYLHPIGEDYLLGFGRSGTMDGLDGGLQLSLFDVSDLSDPRQVAVHDFGDNDYEYSSATHDHRSFQYFDDTQTIAVPVSTADGTHLELIKLDLSAGFTKLGEVATDVETTDQMGLRGIRLADSVFAVGGREIKSADMTTGQMKDSLSVN
jgi:uncharacterized secreted protein with C-terminal beta-propeller domain